MSETEFTYKFNTLSHYLRSFAYKLTRDSHLAEDLFQDTALRAFNNQDKFVKSTNMKAWLSTIMKNTFINNFRRKQRWSKVIIQTDENYLMENESKAVWNKGEEKVSGEALEQLVNDLDEGMRVPFLMMLQGFKYHEIADRMELPLGTIKSRIFMARRQLKEQIKKLYRESASTEMAA
ncbi:RNA polymerase sigma factor [Flavilitoribacter nigricans]|nr:RNA polymerase sigma factor [Flavilitoribacter nigricans]